MAMIANVPPLPPRKRFTRPEYDRIAELGLWEGQRIELIEGEIVCMSPIGSRHNAIVNVCDEVTMRLFGRGFAVRVQSSFLVPDETELEPDIAVVPGSARDYLRRHPEEAALIIEVAETSLEYDTTTKASLYARAGVPDYWVIDLNGLRLLTFRAAAPDATMPFGYGYQESRVYLPGDTIAPLAKPKRSVAVSDILP